MAKTTKASESGSPLEAIALQLEPLRVEAAELGEESVARGIASAIKSARWADKNRAARAARFTRVIEAMKARGLSAEEIVAALSR